MLSPSKSVSSSFHGADGPVGVVGAWVELVSLAIYRRSAWNTARLRQGGYFFKNIKTSTNSFYGSFRCRCYETDVPYILLYLSEGRMYGRYLRGNIGKGVGIRGIERSFHFCLRSWFWVRRVGTEAEPFIREMSPQPAPPGRRMWGRRSPGRPATTHTHDPDGGPG